ncbi:hypothetical protein M501DRAFT_1054177 [Patellaria atrata CBS 101060]|uniref:Uncharacterized protein n=1 Tax=Patellaria atrata CBS 101060 TaxID=1346257 RepID=A0A9P4SJF2_9PEZI|nr:hypothetical protein M501DRAFT_1054177 [Patellaria atrata CBS 101060]
MLSKNDHNTKPDGSRLPLTRHPRGISKRSLNGEGVGLESASPSRVPAGLYSYADKNSGSNSNRFSVLNQLDNPAHEASKWDFQFNVTPLPNSLHKRKDKRKKKAARLDLLDDIFAAGDPFADNCESCKKGFSLSSESRKIPKSRVTSQADGWVIASHPKHLIMPTPIPVLTDSLYKKYQEPQRRPPAYTRTQSRFFPPPSSTRDTPVPSPAAEPRLFHLPSDTAECNISIEHLKISPVSEAYRGPPITVVPSVSTELKAFLSLGHSKKGCWCKDGEYAFERVDEAVEQDGWIVCLPTTDEIQSPTPCKFTPSPTENLLRGSQELE